MNVRSERAARGAARGEALPSLRCSCRALLLYLQRELESATFSNAHALRHASRPAGVVRVWHLQQFSVSLRLSRIGTAISRLKKSASHIVARNIYIVRNRSSQVHISQPQSAAQIQHQHQHQRQQSKYSDSGIPEEGEFMLRSGVCCCCWWPAVVAAAALAVSSRSFGERSAQSASQASRCRFRTELGLSLVECGATRLAVDCRCSRWPGGCS